MASPTLEDSRFGETDAGRDWGDEIGFEFRSAEGGATVESVGRLAAAGNEVQAGVDRFEEDVGCEKLVRELLVRELLVRESENDDRDTGRSIDDET